MGSAEVEELEKFRRNIARAGLADLGTIIASTLDEMIDVVRGLGGGGDLGVEMAAALSAELHKRNATGIRSPQVGTA